MVLKTDITSSRTKAEGLDFQSNKRAGWNGGQDFFIMYMK